MKPRNVFCIFSNIFSSLCIFYGSLQKLREFFCKKSKKDLPFFYICWSTNICKPKTPCPESTLAFISRNPHSLNQYINQGSLRRMIISDPSKPRSKFLRWKSFDSIKACYLFFFLQHLSGLANTMGIQSIVLSLCCLFPYY